MGIKLILDSEVDVVSSNIDIPFAHLLFNDIISQIGSNYFKFLYKSKILHSMALMKKLMVSWYLIIL
jgi:hypothetical protein